MGNLARGGWLCQDGSGTWAVLAILGSQAQIQVAWICPADCGGTHPSSLCPGLHCSQLQSGVPTPAQGSDGAAIDIKLQINSLPISYYFTAPLMRGNVDLITRLIFFFY